MTEDPNSTVVTEDPTPAGTPGSDGTEAVLHRVTAALQATAGPTDLTQSVARFEALHTELQSALSHLDPA